MIVRLKYKGEIVLTNVLFIPSMQLVLRVIGLCVIKIRKIRLNTLSCTVIVSTFNPMI